MGLIRELRHRNVFRVAAAYCVVGWLVAQVADLAADNFGAPGWVMRMLLVALLLGLPVALFLAWAYELTPQGVVKAKDLPEGTPKDPRSGRFLNRVIIATLAIAVIGLLVDRFLASSDTPAGQDGIADKSIAVLPFADFSPAGDQAWFADGLAEEVLNALARIEDLRVASRTSAFAYRGTALDVPAIAAELGVAHVLEGSVRRSDDRVRVTAQLIRAADDKHLWSETFDGDSGDSIAIQENIARVIARALDTAMDPQKVEQMIDAGTTSIAAWEAYLKARAMSARSSATYNFDDYGFVVAKLREAVTIDPGFFDAQTALAAVYLGQLQPSLYGAGRLELTEGDAHGLAREALQAAASSARSERDRLEVRAMQASREVRLKDLAAIREQLAGLAPNDRQTLLNWGDALIDIGDYPRAREVLLRARSADAQPDDQAGELFRIYRVDLDAALASVDAALADPSPPLADLYQGHRVYLHAGRIEDAARVASVFLLGSDDPVSRSFVQVRQACAEGRDSDAHGIYAEFVTRLEDSGLPAYANNNWLLLKTLGRTEEAREVLRPLDTPDGLYALSGFLTYPQFDASDFPLLNRTLAAQGIARPPPTDIPFACGN